MGNRLRYIDDVARDVLRVGSMNCLNCNCSLQYIWVGNVPREMQFCSMRQEACSLYKMFPV